MEFLLENEDQSDQGSSLKSEQPGIKRSKERKDGKKFSFQVLSWRKVEVNFPAFLVT